MTESVFVYAKMEIDQFEQLEVHNPVVVRLTDLGPISETGFANVTSVGFVL